MNLNKDLVFTIDNKELPAGWSLATLDEMIGKSGVFVDGDWIESKDQDPEGDVRLIQLADVGDGLYRNKSARFLADAKARELKCTFLKRGDVLVARMPDPLGRACIFPGDSKKAVTVVDVAIVRPESDFDSKWLMYFVNAPLFRGAVASMESGSTRKRISRKNLEKIAFPVPPHNEQTRIVAEIEKQFSRLDEAVANLKRVKANLKRYKAAVLKAAVEGKLTEEWRRQHPEVESADKLLARILAERRKGAGKGKYKEPVGPETANLPELPEGWVWTNFEQLAEAIPSAIKAGPFGSALKKSYYVQEGYKIYGQEQVIREDPYYGDYYIDDERYQELSSCAVKPRDLLISLVGTIGRVLILPDDIEPGIINPRLVKVSLDRHLVSPQFIKIYLQSTFVKTLFTIASHGGTMDILNLGILKEIPIPLPPIKEQAMILEEFDRISSIEAELASTIESNRVRADRLRQSILKQAFSGQLVPQDPNDEPASVLLERIRNGVGAIHESPAFSTRKQKRAIHESPLREPRPQTEPAPAASDRFACLDDVTAAILGRMHPGREYSRVDLANALGLTTSRWNVAIQDLKRQRKVRQVGEKRGARYLLNGKAMP